MVHLRLAKQKCKKTVPITRFDVSFCRNGDIRSEKKIDGSAKDLINIFKSQICGLTAQNVVLNLGFFLVTFYKCSRFDKRTIRVKCRPIFSLRDGSGEKKS